MNALERAVRDLCSDARETVQLREEVEKLKEENKRLQLYKTLAKKKAKEGARMQKIIIELRSAGEAYLEDMGPCEGQEDEEYCTCVDPDCSYCALARAVQPGVYPPAEERCRAEIPYGCTQTDYCGKSLPCPDHPSVRGDS